MGYTAGREHARHLCFPLGAGLRPPVSKSGVSPILNLIGVYPFG